MAHPDSRRIELPGEDSYIDEDWFIDMGVRVLQDRGVDAMRSDVGRVWDELVRMLDVQTKLGT